jgi:hypothetical protein
MTSVIQKILASETDSKLLSGGLHSTVNGGMHSTVNGGMHSTVNGGMKNGQKLNNESNDKFYDANVLLSMLTSEEPPKQHKGGAVLNTDTPELQNKLSTLLDNTLSTTEFNTKINKQLKGGKDSDASVNTQFLENKLLNLISDKKPLSGGDKNSLSSSNKNINVGDVKKFFVDLKSKGVNVDVKLNDKTFSEYFDMRATTTDINSVKFSPTSTENMLNGKLMTPTYKKSSKNNVFSATSDMQPSENNVLSATSEMQGGNTLFSATSEMQGGNGLFSATSEMQGGNGLFSATSEMQGGNGLLSAKPGVQPHDIFLSATSEMQGGNGLLSPTSSMDSLHPSMTGGKRGSNPGFLAHIKLTQYIAKKLGIKGGPDAMKISSVVKQDAKDKFPSLDSVAVAKKAEEIFDKNIEHYKKLLKSK